MGTLTTIVPRLPPTIDGVGDYALALARELRKEFGMETKFVVGDPKWSGPTSIDGVGATLLAKREPQHLLTSLINQDAGPVLLHYGGYAYEPRGCPTWLVDALTAWKNDHQQRGLVTIFHELYADGPPWTSSFWLSHQQRNLVRRLAKISDVNLTSLDLYAKQIEGMGTKAESLPVFSSIGEPKLMPAPLTSRRRRIVVFGNRGRRALVYRRSARDLNRICRELQIEEIADIGSALENDVQGVSDLPVTFHGELDGKRVSEILLDSVAGVIDYPENMLSKSTVFAAFCAHRMLPFVAGYRQPESSDGLKAGVDYQIIGGAGSLNPTHQQKTADSAFGWYQKHTLLIHAQRLVARLANLPAISQPISVHG
jgi:hypothetical protein